MKLLLCADIRLGAICTENLDTKLSRKWQAARTQKLEDLLDSAAKCNAGYVALLGQMFGQERVSESVIDSFFSIVKGNKHIQVMVFLIADEYNRIAYRSDVPENLHLICTQTPDTYTDDHIALRINKGIVELQLGDNEPVFIRKALGASIEVMGLPKILVVPRFEPIGFEDASSGTCGYAVLEWTDDTLGKAVISREQKYAYKDVELKISPADMEKDILRKINTALKNISADTFLRITITGRSAFGVMLNEDALAKQLQSRIFFVEIHDNTIMDIDEEAFENDISLRSEFVRLALQDDSLSESERNRLICCGWNALNGKEVSGE